MADQEIIDLNLTDDVPQAISGMTFAQAQPAAIRFVRKLTRKIIAAKAKSRDIIDLQDTILNSPGELAAIAVMRQACDDFMTSATLATTLAELSTAWNTYKTDIGL